MDSSKVQLHSLSTFTVTFLLKAPAPSSLGYVLDRYVHIATSPSPLLPHETKPLCLRVVVGPNKGQSSPFPGNLERRLQKTHH